MSIDRQAVVGRHAPSTLSIDPEAVFAIGNGQLAFSADVTGFQSLNASYGRPFPLCTLTDWMWHTSPFPAGACMHACMEVAHEPLPCRLGARLCVHACTCMHPHACICTHARMYCMHAYMHACRHGPVCRLRVLDPAHRIGACSALSAAAAECDRPKGERCGVASRQPTPAGSRTGRK